MSEQEFRRALGYANSAMDLLKRGQIPPYPQFYELLYTYATGVNPSLNQRINQIFRDGTATVELAERLYNEFLKAQDANERISNVSERMATRIEAVRANRVPPRPAWSDPPFREGGGPSGQF